MRFRIGIDFDNTVVCYDKLFVRTAKTEGLIPYDFRGGKAGVRELIRKLDGGEDKWQRLQGKVYGDQMGSALLFDGVAQFLQEATNAPTKAFSMVGNKTKSATSTLRASTYVTSHAPGWLSTLSSTRAA